MSEETEDMYFTGNELKNTGETHYITIPTLISSP